MGRFIPLSIPNFEGNESRYVNDALNQGWVSTGGAYISELEKNMAQFLGVNNVAACQSGTSAIHLALIESDVTPGDMVIVPTLTFIAAVNPVRYQFAEPVFMDCDDSLCMDVKKLEKFCREECSYENHLLIHKRSGKRVKAVIVVHVFGNMADMESIMRIAREYNLKVIEDATEALGTYYTSGCYKGMYAGTIGDFGAFSFNGNKIITTGGGGAVTARKPDMVDHIRYLSTQSKDDPYFYIHNEVGFNYRMTNLQAALGVAQLEKLQEFIERKHKNYDLYKKLFKDFEYGRLLEFRKDIFSNQWFYSLEIDRNKISADMSVIIERLQDMGIQTRTIWGLIHEQLPYQNALAYEINMAYHYSSSILNIPCSTQISEPDIYYVAESIRDLLGELSDE